MILIEFKDSDLAMLRATLACAAKDERPRWALHGIRITQQNISASNGHRYAQFNTPGKHADFDVIVPKFVLSKSVTHLVMMIDGNQVTLHLTRKEGMNSTSEQLTAIDGKFPDLSRVIPSDGDTCMVDKFKFNPVYLSDVTRALDLPEFPCVTITATGGEKSVYRVDFKDYPDLAFGIMPIFL